MKIIQRNTIQHILSRIPTFHEYINLEGLAFLNYARFQNGQGILYFNSEEHFNNTKQELISLIEKSEVEPVFIDGDCLELSNYLARSQYKTHFWFFKGNIYELQQNKENFSEQQEKLLVLEYYDRDRKKWEKLNHLYGEEKPQDTMELGGRYVRQNIPEKVRIEVWRRDDGKCAKCGSRERLEYDHIVPVSRGGANTARNIELLCEKCNREKYNNIQ